MVTWFRFCKCSNAITVCVLVAWSHDPKRPQTRPSFSAMRFIVIVVIYVYKPEIILDMVRVLFQITSLFSSDTPHPYPNIALDGDPSRCIGN